MDKKEGRVWQWVGGEVGGGGGGADAWGRQLFVVHTCSFTGDYKMNGKTNQHQIYLMIASRQLKSVLKLGQHLSQTKSMHKHNKQQLP